MKRKVTQINMNDNYNIIVEESIDTIENNLRNQGWFCVKEIKGGKHILASNEFKHMFEIDIDEED
jgi:23S rRNA U2552 (ribose-2'-O)-methylase RlmE/FtsJ